MKFVIDFDEVEGVKDQLQMMTEEIDEFVGIMDAIKDEVEGTAELESVKNILLTQEQAIQQIKEIKTAFETAYDDLDEYICTVDGINGYTVGEVYKHDTLEFAQLLNKATKICNTVYTTRIIIGMWYEDYVDDYQVLINHYNDAEAYIDLEKDYKDDTETQEYIKKRRIEIEKDIKNFKANSELIEEMSGNLTNFQKVLEGFEDGFVKLKETNTALEEYEKSKNPGFLDKNNTLKILGKFTHIDEGIAGIKFLVANPHLALAIGGCIPFIGWACDSVDALLYLAEGDYANAALSGLAVVPILGASIRATEAVTRGAKFGTKASKVLEGFKAYHKSDEAFKVIFEGGESNIKNIDDILRTAKKGEMKVKLLNAGESFRAAVNDFQDGNYTEAEIETAKVVITKYSIMKDIAKL